MTYTNDQYYNDLSGNPAGIRCDINGVTSFIPPDPANTDYAAYLEWVAAGNMPEPAPAPES